MQQFVLRVFGSPEQFGAFEPAGDFVTVGRALSQHYLPLVAEGRIVPKPWIDKIAARPVPFHRWELRRVRRHCFRYRFRSEPAFPKP